LGGLQNCSKSSQSGVYIPYREDPEHQSEIEAMLIAAVPTANGAKPKLQNRPYSESARKFDGNLSGVFLSSVGTWSDLSAKV
jgi:hypothetical protein